MSGLRNLGPVFAYFNANALKTNKADSYKLFVELYDRLRPKHHLDPVLRAELKAMAAKVNPGYQYKSGK